MDHDDDNWLQQEECERRLFQEAQELLREDAESYIRWLIELEQELDRLIPVSGFVPGSLDFN